jgi:3-(3-hydroxy-phenyl)propionate hydroxylase
VCCRRGMSRTGTSNRWWDSRCGHSAQRWGCAPPDKEFAKLLAGWVGELAVPIYRGREVRGIVQDDSGVEVSDGRSLRAKYLVGCEGGGGGGTLIRKAAGIEFSGWDPTRSCLIAEVEMAEEPE